MNNQSKSILGVAVIIQNKNGEFLLHLRDGNARYMKNQWCLLGGHIEEEDESSEHATVREIKEETGVDVNPGDLNFLKKITSTDGIHKTFVYGVAIVIKPEMIKIGEGEEFRFFSKKESLDLLQNLDYTNPFLKVFNEFINSKK